MLCWVSAMEREMQGAGAHEEKAGPLDGNLDNAQQSSGTRKGAYVAATGHVASALRQGQDVGDAGGARDGAKQDEEGAEAARGAAGDDLVVLGKVRDEDADDDEDGDGEVDEVWMGQLAASGGR